MDSIELNIINKLGSLDRWVQPIEDSVNYAFIEIGKHLELDELTITILDKPQWAIPELGLSGYATDGNHVDIYLDSQYPDLERTIKKELPRTLAHELHHAIRWRNPGYGKTLFEAMISEGLADHFDLEVWGGEARPWNLALNEAEQARLFALARPEYLNNFYNESDWFFGNEDRSIPRWTGYTLGYTMVHAYLADHPQTAAELVSAPAYLFTPYAP